MLVKSCPFCGGQGQLIQSFDVYVYCRKCGAKGPSVRLPNYSSKKNGSLRRIYKAVTSWNNRS